MCQPSTTTTTDTPQQSAQQAGIWNAATGAGGGPQAPLPPMPNFPGMTPAMWAQMNGRSAGGPATQVNGPALPTSAPVYGQPTIAGINNDQYASYDAVRNAAGMAQPGLLSSNNLAAAAAGYRPGLIGNPNLGPAAQTATPAGVNPLFGGIATSGGAGPVSTAGLGVNAPTVGAQNIGTSTLPQTDLSRYMNPYTSAVTDTTLSELERERQAAQSVTSGQALASGAFGGSRSGVMAAQTNENYGRIGAQTLSSLNQANFGQATQNAQIDLARKLQADQANQGANLAASTATGQLGVQAGGINAQTGLTAGLTNANLRQGNNQFNASMINSGNQFGSGLLANTGLANNQLAASVGMANTGAANQYGMYGAGLLAQIQGQNQGAGLTANSQRLSGAGLLANNAVTGQNSALQGATALNQAGTQQQGTSQAQLASAFAQWQQQQQYPFQYYNFLNSLATPGSTTNTKTTTQSPFATIAGLGTSLAGFGKGLGLFGGGDPSVPAAPTWPTPAPVAGPGMLPDYVNSGANGYGRY